MAKLNVTIPANEVVIEGATYRKVDRAAAAGDVVKITEEDAHDSGALTFDAFYRVERMDSAHDPQIIDNYGDEMDLCGWEFEVYEKVSEPVRRLTVGDYVKVTDDKTSWGHTREGVTVGEIREIVFVDSSDCPFRAERLDGTGRVWFREDALVLATEAEVAEAKRKIAQTSDPRSQFAKGDKVRLVSGGGDHPLYGCPNGKVYEVKDPYTTMHSGTRVKITRTDGVGIGFALPSEIVKLTAEEIEALDRIPVGSYVRVLTDEKDLPKDTIGKVTVDDKDSRPYRVEPLVGRDWDWYRKDQLEALRKQKRNKPPRSRNGPQLVVRLTSTRRAISLNT